MKCLELFCGTKSFTKVLNSYGISETETLDNNSIFKPSILADIMGYDFKGSNNYRIIWASPPCQCFSVMSAKYYWKIEKRNGNKIYLPKRKETINALKVIGKTIEIIKYYSPRYWFIENPRGILGKVIDNIFLEHGMKQKDYTKQTITYCKYGEKIMKPTNIWTNFNSWIPRPHCKRGDKCHEAVNLSNKRRSGTIALPDAIHRGVVPKHLCIEIVESILKSER